MRVCVGCGNHNDDDNLFCTGCGQRLWPSSVKRATPQQPRTAAEIKEAKATSTANSAATPSLAPNATLGTGLPTLDAFTRQMNALFFVEPKDCAARLHEIRIQLFNQRTEEKKTSKDGKLEFLYAAPFVESTDDVREEFFSSLAMLIERQAASAPRKRVISLLLELTAIESVSHVAGTRRAATSSESSAFGKSFGWHALRSLKDLMPAVIGLPQLFANCIEEPLAEVINSMSYPQFVAIMPLLLDILRDQDDFGDELYAPLVTISPKLESIWLNLVADMKDGVNYNQADLALLRQVSELISICLKAKTTASSYATLIDTLMVRQYGLFDKLDGQSYHGGERKIGEVVPFSFFALMGRVARASPLEGDRFCNGGVMPPATVEDARFKAILAKFKALPETEADIDRSTNALTFANLVVFMSGLLQSSSVAVRLLGNTEQRNASLFSTKLFKLASSFVRLCPELVAACMDMLLFITRNTHTRPTWFLFAEQMERKVDIAKYLQITMARIIRESRPVKAHKDALICAIEMMTYYNSFNPQVSKQLNLEHEPGYDREAIIFKILKRKNDDFFDDDLKLAAARCLSAVSLAEFDKKEIRKLVKIFSVLPALVSQKTYAMMTQLMFLMFKMAIQPSGTTKERSCGHTFRTIYATEVVSTVFGIIDKIIVGDETPIKAEKHKDRFVLACVKFLQTAWGHPEFLPRLEDVTPLTVLLKCLRAEQVTLTSLKTRYYRLVSENRCVDCDDPLFKGKTLRRTDRPIVRCDACIRIQDQKGIHQRWGYSHLFMEQSSVGFNIPNMFKCLRALREVDVATFRCFHQIANILEDTTHREVLDNLIDQAHTGTTEESYTHWSEAASGDGIKYCEDIDKLEWDERDAQLRTIQEATFLFSPPTPKDLVELKDIESKYRQELYGWENKGMPPAQWPGIVSEAKDVETILKERGDDQRTVFLCLRVNRRPDVPGVRRAPKKSKEEEGEGKSDEAAAEDDGKGKWEDEDGSQILAFVAGGVARTPPKDIEYATEGHNAELYTIFARPQHPNIESLMRRLLAELSHKLCQLGYDRCYSWVHTQERVLFGRASWDVERSKIKKGNQDPAQPDFKTFCYLWELRNNAWVSNTAHEEYCRMNGIETLVNFLVHTTDGEQKHEYIRSYESMIRGKMEEFGGRLAKTFHDEQEKKKKREEDHKGEEKQPSDTREAPQAAPLLPLVERSMMAPSIRLDARSQPAWMNIQTGTKEEVFLMALTSSPALDANYDPEPDPDPIDDPNPDEGESSDEEDDAARIKALEAKLDRKDSKAASVAAAAAVTTPHGTGVANGHAHTAPAAVAIALVNGVKPPVEDPDFLRGSIKAVVAALFRGIHILLTRSTRDNRDRTLAVLQYGHLFDKIKVLCGTFDYGIRTAVQDPQHDQFGICLKYVRIMENMLITLPVGTKESLFYLEVYEQMAHVTVDVTQRLVRLFNSRNTNVRDPLHMLRRFHPTEERLLASIARLAYRLVSHVASITMFRGTLEWIARGNRECRKEAVRLLFTQNDIMIESLYTLILYDFETGTDFSLEEKAAEERAQGGITAAGAAGLRNRRFRPYRDEMRRNLVDVLAEFCRADAAFKYKFIERYNSVMIKADLSLRQSFLDSILGRIDLLNFKDKLGEFLLARGVIGSNGADADEYIVDLSFVDHSIYRRTNTLSPKLFILTNHAYYLSIDSFDDDVTSVIHELSPASLPMFLNLQRREYADVTKLVRDRADQMWSIERFTQGPNIRLRNTLLPKVTEIFVARRLGVTGNLLWYMQRMCRNDMNQTIPLREDFFTDEVVREALYSHPKVGITKTYAILNLITHVTIKKGPGNYAKRLLLLVSQAENMHLICVRYDRKSWHSVMSASDKENKEAIIERGKKFFCLGTSEPLHTKLSALDVVEFTENNEPHMILGFNKQKLHVVFHCDAARELWRREIKNYLMKDPNWTTSIMPALKAASRSVSKLF